MAFSRLFHFNAQHSLLEKMQQLGFTVNPEGVCAGATMVAIESFINHGHIHAFEDMIKFIKSNNFKITPISTSNQLFSPVKNQQMIDALAMLDQIQLYHKPEIYHALFTETVSQYESHKISSLAQSTKSIDNQGFITNVNWAWSGIYDEKTLTSLLDVIKNANTSNQLLTFQLGNVEHKIALAYQDGIWTLININRMPSSTFTDTSKLAKKLLKILGIKNHHTAAFTATAYTSGVNTERTQYFFDNLYSNEYFKKHHRISRSLIHHDKILELAQLAICNHQSTLLIELIEKGLNVDATTPSGFSLTYLAAQYGFTDMLTLLINAGAKIDIKEGKDGVTPLLIAIERQHYHAISLLIEHGASVNNESYDHHTPILSAANIGDLASVKLLSEHGARLSERSIFGTPAEVARRAGRMDVVDYIEEQLTNTSQNRN